MSYLRRCGILAALWAASTLPMAAAQSPPSVQYRLVKDIGQGPGEASSDPNDFVASGGKIFFNATTPGKGNELYVSDGVSARLAVDLAPNGAPSFAHLLGRIGGTLIVSADAGNVGSGLYPLQRQIQAVNAADGSYVTLTQFPPLTPNAVGVLTPPFQRVAEISGHVLFRRRADDSLWSTDGTAQGTQALPVTLPALFPDFDQTVCALDDRLVFTRMNAAGLQLWSSDGTPAGTGIIAVYAQLGGSLAARRDGAGCFFLAVAGASNGWAVLQSNGSSAGSGIVESSSTTQALTPIAVNGGAAYLREWDAQAPQDARARLRRAGQAEPVWSGENFCSDWFLVQSAGRLVFSVRDPFNNDGSCRIMVSDGTAAGTRPVLRNGTPLSLRNAKFLNLGDAVVAIHDHNRVDRIAPLAATALESVLPFGGDLLLQNSAVLDGVAYFAMYGEDGAEPWRSDGTLAGTRQLADLAFANASGVLDYPAVARDGKLVFRGAGGGLWRSDGSEAGTHALTAGPYGGNDTMALLPFGGGIVFATRNSTDHFMRVYRSDMNFSNVSLAWTSQPGFNYSYLASDASLMFGCNSGTQQFCAYRDGDAMPSVIVAQPGDLRYVGSAGDTLLFYNNGDLWRSDGTAPGTFPLLSGPFRNPNIAAVEVDGRLWFEGCDDYDLNCRLLVSDGTAAGTRVVAGVGGDIDHLTAFADGVVFRVKNLGAQLWRSDGSAAGTRLVADLGATAQVDGLGVIGDRIHLVLTRANATDWAYVVSDGSSAGTADAAWAPGLRRAYGRPRALDAQTAAFSCYGDAIGIELCAVDRLGQHMTVVADFYQGPQSSAPSAVGATGGALYYTLDDGQRGRELWRVVGDGIFADGFR